LAPGTACSISAVARAPLARAFAPIAREVIAIDPNPEMLAAARALAAEATNLHFLAGSSHDVGPPLGHFHLVVMGRSFHWMDRVDTLKRLDRMIEPAGALALFHDSAHAVPANAWQKVWHDIRERYEPHTGPHQHDQLDPRRGDPARLSLRPPGKLLV